MKRLIYKDLLAWKESTDRRPLILLGARQVGKTWIMREFGRKEYANVAYINCDNEQLVRDVFESDYDIDRILLAFQAITGTVIDADNTLIILDEIQSVPRGLHSLKYFCEEAPEYHVMAAGSLLGITLRENEAFPVGKVDMLEMYPMNFSEFLDATGNTHLIDLLNKRDWGLISAFSSKFESLLRQYYFVGGMPQIVDSFIKENNLSKVRTLQEQLIIAYRNDISKHTSKTEAVRIGQVLDSLVSQLAKENRKFIYGAVKKGARASDFELAIRWLADAGLVYKVNRIKEPRMPLKFYEDIDAFKLFMLDCGLLGCMAGVSAKDIILADNALVEFKGAFTEQYVMQQLKSGGLNPFYWSNDRTPAEIDFIVQYDGRIIPIEVKAEKNVKSKSLKKFCDDHNLVGLRFSMLGYDSQERIINVPLYAAGAYFGG